MGLNNLVTHWPNVMLFVITFAWASLMFIAPLSQPPDTVDLGDKGIVFPQLDNEKKYEHIDNYLVRRIYESGDRNCHQHGSRSVFINGNQMPYCSRCVAIFVGMALGALISLLVFVRLDWKWVVAGLVPMGIDGTIQLFTSYESNNLLRILTGLPAGLITTLALGGVMFEMGIMFEKLREEKMLEFKAKSMKGPRVPYGLRAALYSGAILLLIAGLVGADYALHNGYKEEVSGLRLTAMDDPFTSSNTTLVAGDPVVVIEHVKGENLDWAKLNIFLNGKSHTYRCVVLTINGKPYDRITEHISESGDTVVLTAADEGVPQGSAVYVELLEGSSKVWTSPGEIIIR